MDRLKNFLMIFTAIAMTAFLLKRLLGAFAITVPLMFMFFDVGYSLRVVWLWMKMRMMNYRVDLMDKSVMTFHVLPSDLDVFLHMNNSRYLRALDFARFEHFLGSGMSSVLSKHKCRFILAATTIRYRRSLELFQKIKLTTKIVYWDDRAFYFEHHFIDEEGFVSAVAFSKVAVTQTRRQKDDRIPMKVLFEEASGSVIDVLIPPRDLEHWLECNTLSSEALSMHKKEN